MFSWKLCKRKRKRELQKKGMLCIVVQNHEHFGERETERQREIERDSESR